MAIDENDKHQDDEYVHDERHATSSLIISHAYESVTDNAVRPDGFARKTNKLDLAGAGETDGIRDNIAYLPATSDGPALPPRDAAYYSSIASTKHRGDVQIVS